MDFKVKLGENEKTEVYAGIYGYVPQFDLGHCGGSEYDFDIFVKIDKKSYKLPDEIRDKFCEDKFYGRVDEEAKQYINDLQDV